MTDVQEYLTAAEVAKKLRLSMDTVYRLLADGKIRGVRRGERGGWLVEPAAIAEYLTRPRGVPVMPPADVERLRRGEAAAEELRARGYKIG